MTYWICVTCGTQFAESTQPPEGCPICLDQRQYVGHNGQQWTTLAAMAEQNFHSEVQEHEPDLLGIGTQPTFAIGQRALLVRTPQGNILWDCVSYIDQPTIKEIERLGGITAIAISHPHFYSSMVQWAEHFDARIYLHAADQQWVMRPDPRIVFWSGETLSLLDEQVTLIRLGGHFTGGTVLYWPSGAQGQGALLTGDIIQVVADHNWVSFMYSYPNLIPLPASEVARIRDAIAPYHYTHLYGGWFDRLVSAHADEVVQRSADRYISALTGDLRKVISTR